MNGPPACDLTNYTPYGDEWELGCGAAAPNLPSDSHSNTFTPIEHHGNGTYDWAENEYYAIIPQTGTDTITFVPIVTCSPSPCTYKAMIEQVQGIQADQ